MSLVADYQVDVRIAGEDYGTWDSMVGGAVDSTARIFKPGGRKKAKNLGGTQEVSELTLGTLYEEFEHTRLVPLMNMAGKAEVKCVKTFITPDGATIGDPISYVGTLKTVTPPDHDSESDDAGMLTIVVTVAEVPS